MPADAAGREAVGAGEGAGRLPLGRRIYGFGSIFGKTVRDSRRALAAIVAVVAGLMFVAGGATSAAFGTLETRHEAEVLARSLPAVFQGLLGRLVNLQTLGGVLEWRYHVVFLLLPGIWGILALSSTLATEARRGSLEFVATAPIPRRRIAAEKLAAHVAMVGLAVAAVATSAWLTGALFAVLPGDSIAPGAAIGYGVLVGLMILTPGAVAWALAPFVGRGAAVGIAAVVMVAAFLVNGFRDSIPGFEVLTPLSWYAWTTNHLPLAGFTDWPSLLPVVTLVVVLWIVGIVAFERRDVGGPIAIPTPGLPRALLGLHGPLGRAFGERLPASLAWGAGIGLYALVLAGSARAVAESIGNSPAVEKLVRAIFPHVDYTTPAGILQLVFVDFAVVVFGFAGATLVSGWASDESSGRLELVLSAPLRRAQWAIRSGLGAYLAIFLVTLVASAGGAIGAASAAGDPVAPAVGMLVPGLYAAALAGVGIAVGGLVRPSLAVVAVVTLTMGTFLLDLFAPPLNLPDWVQQLALSNHLGHPMVGQWDVAGLLVCAGLAVGGLLVGAWGFQRRDVAT